jgi:hypothetical protein
VVCDGIKSGHQALQEIPFSILKSAASGQNLQAVAKIPRTSDGIGHSEAVGF